MIDITPVVILTIVILTPAFVAIAAYISAKARKIWEEAQPEIKKNLPFYIDLDALAGVEAVEQMRKAGIVQLDQAFQTALDIACSRLALRGVYVDDETVANALRGAVEKAVASIPPHRATE
jgi:hypothetical protein